MGRWIPRSRAARAALGLGGLIVLAAAWYLGSPLFVRTTANEALPTAAATSSAPASAAASSVAATSSATTAAPTTFTLAKGELQYVDSIHNGKGPVSILRVGSQHFVRFDGVMITNAPDIHVYLSRESGGKWSEATSLYLGALKANNGAFNYEVPTGMDLSQYRSVVVWCRNFSVLITWADLTAL